MLNKSIEYIIQKGLEDERKISPSLYEPSPGQIPSHVDYRVTQAVLKILATEGLAIIKIGEVPSWMEIAGGDQYDIEDLYRLKRNG